MLRLAFLLILAKVVIAVDPEVHEKYRTLPLQEFIEYFNSKGFTWTIKEYDRTFHFGALLSDNLNGYLDKSDTEILDDLPKAFDSRDQWQTCETIREINDQGLTCGSCWTFGTANTASDRTCIHKGIHVHLAEQDFECQNDHVCGGGFPSQAFDFWKDKGLVSNKCKPYNVEKLNEHTCNKQCVDGNISYEKDKHYAEKIYTIAAESDVIKSEIVKNGPIQASFHAYEDIRHYNGGIYEHKYGDWLGGHSVRIIGYGVENNTEYWLVANSWGKNWGENGIIKIKTFQEELQFESSLITGIPKN